MPWYNPEDPKQRNAGIVGIVLLALIYPYNAFYHSGQRETVATLADSVETLENANTRAQVLAARGGGRIEETMAEYERQVAQLEELIPASAEVSTLLDEINQRARQFNVRPNDLNPETPESVGIYERQAYQMSFVGEYHDVGRLLAEIASLSRIVRPLELSVTAWPQPQQFPQYRSPVLADFRIETYVLPRRVEAPAGGAEGASS